MTRQPRPERWTQIVVAKPVCAPMRSVITGALDPYGIVYRASYEYAIKTIDPRKLPKGEIERSGGLVMCYVAKIQVRERAAVWAEYLLLRTHRLMLLSTPKHPRNARWVAKFDRDAKVWTAPVDQADRLLAAFPKASYDYDALCAAFDRQDARIGIFGQSLLDMGVTLVVVDSRVIAQGDGVSPLLQSLVDERGENLRVWLDSTMPDLPHEYVCGTVAGAMQVQSINDRLAFDAGRLSEDLRQAELLATSMRNAAQNQYQQEAMRQRGRRGKVKAKA